MEKRSYYKEGVTRTEANRIIRNRNRKWNTLWVLFCIGIFFVATLLYWYSVNTNSFMDKAHTVANILLAMSTSGMVVFIYRIPMIRNMNASILEKWCLIIICLCVVINVCLSIPFSTNLITYFMTIVTGFGTGSAALMFASFDKRIEESNESDQKWVHNCPQNRK